MSSYQQKQIKIILLVIFALMAAFYFTQLRQEPLPKEISRTQKHLYKHIDTDLKLINNRYEFQQWAIQKKYKEFNASETEYKTTIRSLKLKDDPCEWIFTLSVDFGIQIKASPKQYVDKIMAHRIDPIKLCPN